MNAYNCIVQENLNGLLDALENLNQKEVFPLIEIALSYKQQWALPHLLRFLDTPHTRALYFAIVYRNNELFDTIYNTTDWTSVPQDVAHNFINLCATDDYTYGFFKLLKFVQTPPCSKTVPIVVEHNNSEILSHILSNVALNTEEQRECVIKAIRKGHDACLDVLLPHLTGLTFKHKDIHDMMDRGGVKADLLRKIDQHFTTNNFNTLLRLACVEENEDVFEFAFPHAQMSKVLKKLDGPPPAMLQERINQAQNKRILKKIKTKPSPVSVRKM